MLGITGGSPDESAALRKTVLQEVTKDRGSMKDLENMENRGSTKDPGRYV